MRGRTGRRGRLIAVVTAGGVVAWASGRSMPGALLTALAETGTVTESVDAGGPVRPVTALALDFGAPGAVLNVNVAVGQRVERGSILATIDASSAATQLAQVEQTLTAATTRLVQDTKAPPGLRTAQGTVASGGQQLGASQRTLDDTRRAGAVNVNGSQLSLQQTQTTGQGAVTAAQAQVASAEQNLADVQRIGTSNVTAAQLSAQSAVAQAQATVDSDQAQLLAAQANLADAVRADQGKVGTATASVQAAQTVLRVAEETLAADQAQLSRDEARLSADCDASHTSSACAGDEQVASTDRQTVSSDLEAVAQARGTLLTSQAALSEAQATARQNADQAQTQVDAAAVAVRDAQAALAVVVHGGQATLAQAQAQAQQAVDQAHGQLVTSQIDAQNRQAALQAALALGRNDVAKAQVEAQQGTDQAQSLIDAASVALGTSQAVLGDLQGVTIPQTVITDEGAVQSAQQQVVDAQHILDGATLVAPISGVVSEVNVVPGETLSPQTGGASTTSNAAGPGPAVVSHAIVLSTPGADEVDVTLSDPRLGPVRVGDAVQVHPEASTETLPGTVTKITRVGGTGTTAPTYAITVVVDARGAATPLGRRVTVTFTPRQVSGAVTVPTSAVITDGPADVVLVSTGDRVTPRIVAVQARDASRSAILAGVQANDLVVIGQAPARRGTAGRLATGLRIVEEDEDERRDGDPGADDPEEEATPEFSFADVEEDIDSIETTVRERMGPRRSGRSRGRLRHQPSEPSGLVDGLGGPS